MQKPEIFKWLILKSYIFLVIFFLIIIVSYSISSLCRWDYLDHISMADSFFHNGSLYPKQYNDSNFGVSVYFPGLSFVAVIFKSLGVEKNLPEIFLILAFLIFISFILIQKKIFELHFKESITYKKTFILAIIFLISTTSFFMKYALEFKPDTLSYLMGFSGLLVFYKKPHVKYRLFAILLISLGLLFKQQYITFISGFLFFLILDFKKNSKYIFLLTFLSLTILGIFFIDKNIWFWSIEIFKTHSFRSPFIVLNDFKKLFLNAITPMFILILFNIRAIKKKKINFYIKTPFYFIIILSIISALISGLKIGGNLGNFELGFFFLFPLFCYLFKETHNWILIIIAWIFIFSSYKTFDRNLYHYNEIKDLKTQVEQLKEEHTPKKVLSGSNTYYAARQLLNENSNIDNYWVNKELFSGDKKPKFPDGCLEISLSKNKYDIIIIESFNLLNVEEYGYKTIFKNGAGLIATRRSP